MINLKTILFVCINKTNNIFEYFVHYLLIPIKLHVELLIYTTV